MSSAVVVASIAAAITVMAGVRLLVPPRRPLAARLRPYAGLSRSRLGTGQADVTVLSLAPVGSTGAVRPGLASVLATISSGLGSVIDAADNETLERRLRHAGFGDVGVDQYRMRQLGYAVAGTTFGATLGLTLFESAGGTLLLAALFGFPGATIQRNQVERAIADRRARMRTEVYTVAHLVAVRIRTGHGPVDAVRAVCRSGRGPVLDELREALGWISNGVTPAGAYDTLADSTAEPAAGRLYRLLGSSARSGGDIAESLLSVGEDLRSQRRDELARSAVRRRTAMLIPLLLLIAPVMVLFVGAALPSMVLGPVR